MMMLPVSLKTNKLDCSPRAFYFLRISIFSFIYFLTSLADLKET